VLVAKNVIATSGVECQKRAFAKERKRGLISGREIRGGVGVFLAASIHLRRREVYIIN